VDRVLPASTPEGNVKAGSHCSTERQTASAALAADRHPTPRPTSRLSHLTDAELLLEQAWNPVAFEAVFMRHRSAIQRYVARRVEPAVVDDLVAETFTVAFDRRARYRPQYPDARPWLFGIAANLVRHHRRSERARLQAYARVPYEDTTDAVDAAAVARADAQAVRGELVAAVGWLHRGDREALLLLAWGELSYQEIAQALEIPVGTVRSRINRARRRLHELIQDAAAITIREEHQLT
jgi:RNA polymerase sigma-70 factor (ECF subfamily)